MSELKQHILGMPVEKRLELIAFIVSSIQLDQQPETEADLTPQQIKQARQRFAEIDAGQATLIPYETFKANLYAWRDERDTL